MVWPLPFSQNLFPSTLACPWCLHPSHILLCRTAAQQPFCFTKIDISFLFLPQGLCICLSVLPEIFCFHSPTKVTTCVVCSLETAPISGMAGSRGFCKVTRDLSLDKVLALFRLFFPHGGKLAASTSRPMSHSLNKSYVKTLPLY